MCFPCASLTFPESRYNFNYYDADFAQLTLNQLAYFYNASMTFL